MKIAFFIIGIVVVVLGFLITGWTWLDAAANGHVSDAGAYAGPVLIILGLLRMLRAAAATPLPVLARLAVVGLAILLGYADSAAIKAAFPHAALEATTSNQ
jgi:hypothetical protein